MPIYEFECTRCGHRFDRLQKLSDPDPLACPTCAAPEVNRRISAPSFRLAGSGWYETDFKKEGDKKRHLAGDAGAPAAAPAADSGSKPAAAPAPAPAASPAGGSTASAKPAAAAKTDAS